MKDDVGISKKRNERGIGGGIDSACVIGDWISRKVSEKCYGNRSILILSLVLVPEKD